MTPLTQPPANAYIQLSQVNKIFKSPAGAFHALIDINLTFDRGEFTAIMGKSGSGKSTLINMVTGIDHPTSGVVRVGDVELGRMSEGKMAVWRGRAMGIVFQFFQLLPTLSILENTMLPMDFCNMYDRAERESRAMDLLRLLHLDDMAHKLPAALSGGQQQIAAIARALANDPPIVVADEPTGNLDSITEKLILNIFEDLASRGKTILIVTHDPVLAHRSTRQVFISDGEIINETVAHALSIPNNHKLKVSKAAAPHQAAPGAVLARQGAVDQGMIFIAGGNIQVMRQAKGSPIHVHTLHPGECFSQFDLLETEACGLFFSVAPDAPADLLEISYEKFNALVQEIPTLEPALRRQAAERGALYCPVKTRKSFWRSG
ncbi:MAG TPA: ATP-binding cassette domain-containing protein [Anaerolineaceae bacterium]|nr:ATP-binding cassette domain-containing protein [Anaerolineaceae bacterium]HPN50943.1 ATP-binding cassette domain-containing protein [Anaerolineaceae bacterium]